MVLGGGDVYGLCQEWCGKLWSILTGCTSYEQMEKENEGTTG